jgi:DNA-binding LacI/PurR family transcriptional regulator
MLTEVRKSKGQSVPKYSQLVEQFRQQVQSGALKPGDRLPSYTEMRTQYGVSRPTMDKVLELLESEGAIVREPRRGVFIAEPKRQEKRSIIGFAGFSRDAGKHPYTVHMLEGVYEVAEREDMEILLLGRNAMVEWERVDAILISDTLPNAWLSKLPPGMPHVVLMTDPQVAPSVVADDRRGVYDAVQYLLSLGHRRIGYILSSVDHPINIARVTGYREALQAAGVAPDPQWLRLFPYGIPYTSFLDKGLHVMRQWIQDDWKNLGCTALLAHNDDTAIGAIQALGEAGFSVPRDVSVIGFDGTEISQFFSPRLTSVEVPLRNISALGTEMLLRQIRQHTTSADIKPEHIVVPTRLVVRESTAPPRS